MKDKEKIINFLQNSTEKQFKQASMHNNLRGVDFHLTELYSFYGNGEPYKIRRAMLYRERDFANFEVEDMLFLSEEDERKYIFEAHGLQYSYCTPEYGKYLSDKYHLNDNVTQLSPTLYKHELFKDNIRITYYVEKRRYIYSSAQRSLWEEYKNTYIDINPIIITEVKINDK